MSVVFRDDKGRQVNATMIEFHGDEPCFNCGNPSHGAWAGGGGKYLHICGECAQAVLPILAADAICGEMRQHEETLMARHRIIRLSGFPTRQYDRMKTVFWRALALALLRHPDQFTSDDPQRHSAERNNHEQAN